MTHGLVSQWSPLPQIKELVYQLCPPEEGNKGATRKSYERRQHKLSFLGFHFFRKKEFVGKHKMNQWIKGYGRRYMTPVQYPFTRG